MEKVLLEFFVEKMGGGIISFTLLTHKKTKKKVISEVNLLLMEAKKYERNLLMETDVINENSVLSKSNIFIDGSQIVKWSPMSIVKELAI